MTRISQLAFLIFVFVGIALPFKVSGQELLEAIKADDVQKVSDLLKKDPKLANAKMDCMGAPILYSLLNKRFKAAVVIIEAGADPKVKDDRGENAFHYIAKAGILTSAEVEQILGLVKTLKGKGVPINEYSKFGETPLHTLVLTQVPDKNIPNSRLVLEAMIEAGADSRLEMTNEPRNPLILKTINAMKMGGASMSSPFELLKVLVGKGYDVNATNADKRTGLIMLLMATTVKEEKKIEVVKFLLEYNADVKAKSKKDETALKLVDKKSPLYELLRNPPKQDKKK
ncbi:MAG TPA: hypothetical protein DET40_07040 [Lentisphaeria bacterium]|nr:MAG: hypothetical protein A2X45_07260 [Lentisphaerae bacterium GWF2_50_93]HCE43286.1 hypothetical protein [Lentisphaeria bacterium]